MRFLLNVLRLLVTPALMAIPLVAAAQLPAAQEPVAQQPAAQQPAVQQPTTESQVVDKIVTREQEEMRLIRQFSPLVETYVQNFREDKHLGAVPDGDKYLLGRADFSRGLEVVSLNDSESKNKKFFGSMGNFLAFGKQYVPAGFLQMAFIDTDGFNQGNYKFTYVRREFLGEVRCLVFDLTPMPKSGKGRFVGRIWVEDQDFNIVRFNGSFGPASLTSYYFSFDSWRMNAGKKQWLPAFIYSQQGDFQNAQTKNLAFKPFKAQTRLWGYAPGGVGEDQELTKVLVEAPVTDQAEKADDYSPLLAERSWSRQAEDNVMDSMERLGLMAPHGDVDKILETVVNNLEVTNDLDIQPEVRCRVVMTSTLESFTIGHTIVLSRGLIDVLPDEASLAVIIAHELGHVLLGHHMDTQFGFLNHLRFDEKETFSHFGFGRTHEEEQAANQKGAELLGNSPYKDQTETPRLFLQALKDRSRDIPNLISPHLGDRVPTNWAIASQSSAQSPAEKRAANVIAALPLGGRVKIDPWNGRLQMLKSKPVSGVALDEKMPFEITPFVLFLTRQGDSSTTEVVGTASAKPEADTRP
jgi:Peptidase family M48